MQYIRYKLQLMKSTGICPKCNSRELYTNTGLVKRGDRSLLAISNWKSLFIDVYICATCGFMEEYIAARELENPSTLEKLRTFWKKVNE
jgi:predicted nucleic-acid-binding Zn-ribbon protein